MATRMQQRRGTAATWTAADPILAAGEIGFEIDTNKFKIGDGSNRWANLTYFTADAAAAIEDLIDGAPGLLNTLNELAAAVNDDPNFFATVATNLSNHEADTTNVHGIANTAELATKTFAAELLTNATKTNITITGDKNGLTITAENGVADSDTDDLAEGTTNLYFTDERAQDAVGNAVGTGLTYTDATGEIKVTPNTYDAYGAAAQALSDAEDYADGLAVNYDAAGSAATAQSNAQTFATNAINALDTDDIEEGSSNKYFTDERAQDAVGNAVGTGLTYTDATGEIKVTPNTYDAYGSASAVAGDLSTHESDTTTHGVTGDIVGTSDTQTLTNKTLTSPKINENVALTATSTELNYVDGVTSSIQTQLNNLDTDKADLASPTFTGTVTTDDLVVDGDFTVNGTNFAASATTIVIEDNMVQLAHQNAANTVDLGVVVGYNDGTAKHAGIVRDVSADAWKLFKGVTTEPTTTVDFSEGSLDDLHVAGLTASSITVGDVSNTEFGYLNGVTSGIQDQLDDKAPIDSPTFTGTVSGISKSMVGLGNVDNTSDADKPVSTATQSALDLKAPLASPTFTGTVSGITKSMVGLGNVDNTSDANKPVSTATQTALDAKLDSSTAASTYAPIASPTFTGTVSGITKSMVGLANVDNTSDADKPVSTATQSALDLKAPLASPTFTGTVSGITKSMVGLGNVDNTADLDKPVSDDTQDALNLKANLAGASFTGAISSTGTITSTSNTSSSSTSTGSIVAAGGLGVAGDAYIGGDLVLTGDLTVNGTTTTVSTQDLIVQDPLIYVGEDNNANIVDLGIVASFDNGTYQHTGLVRDASVGTWKLFKGVTDEPTTTINFSQGTLDDLAVGGLSANTITVGDVSNTEFGYLNGVTSSIQTQIDGKISDSSSDTLTNKSINLGTNTITGTIAQFNSAVTDADFATLTGNEILTNKTISYSDNTITVQLANVSDITASTAELNVLDGVTASTAELNVLDGVTASTAELNVLDGVTASTAELNILDGVTATASELNVLDGIIASTTELNYVDGVTSGIQDQLNEKAPLASPTFTGTVVLPLDTSIDNVSGTEISYLDGVTSSIQNQLNAKAPLASPALTGTPTAPTASLGTNTTQVATTAFVDAAILDIVNRSLILDGGGV